MNPYDGNYAMLGSLAFGAAAVLLFGVGAFIAAASLWRLRRDRAPAGLGLMLARHGLDWGRLAAVGSIGEVSSALDRCAECRARARCAQWLESGERDGYRDFCPNAAFFERITVAAKR
jgi:hypothetical protein